MLMEDLAAHMEVVDEAGEAGVLGREAEAWLKGSLATHTYALGTNTETHSYVSYVCMCIYLHILCICTHAHVRSDTHVLKDLCKCFTDEAWDKHIHASMRACKGVYTFPHNF